MQVTQALPPISLSGNLIDLVLVAGATETISVDLYVGAEKVMAELYKPDNAGKIFVRYKKVIHRILNLNIPDSVTLITSQGEACVDFVIKLSSTNGQVETLTFRVIKGSVSTDLLDTVTFLQTSFLTWQPQVKHIQYYDPEWLTYYAQEDCELKIKAFVYPSKTEVVKTLAVLPASQLSTVNLNYGMLVTLFANDGIPSYYDVYVEKNGVRLTYVQRYILSQEDFDFNDVFVFENSLGGIDTIRFTGTATQKPIFEFDNAWFDELNIDYDVRPDYIVEKNTGYFKNNEEKIWSGDFFGSLQKYKNESGELARIYTKDPDLSSIKGELAEYSFNYSFSNKTDAMNLKRPFEAPMALALPGDVVNTVVQLSPRINQYPWANTIDVLVPVQYAFESVWRKLSLKQALASLIISSPGTGGGGGSGSIGILGDWINLDNKSPYVITEDLALEFKTDCKTSLTQAVTFLAGQFFIDPAFVGTNLTLGNIPDGSRPLVKIIQWFTTATVEMFLTIDPNGDVKLESKDGFDLPTGTGDADKYFVNQFFRPNKAFQTSFSGKWIIDPSGTYCEPAQNKYIWGKIFEENVEVSAGKTYADIFLKTYEGTAGAPPVNLSEPTKCTNPAIAITYYPFGEANNTYSASLTDELSKALTAPGTDLGNAKYPKQVILTGANASHYAFDGLGKDTWKLLQTVVMTGNTGNQINAKLMWVSNDVNRFPLDINNELCSISGLPPKTMLNASSNPNYKVLNIGACPVTPPEEGGGGGSFKNFTLEQYGRKFRISGPSTTCGLMATINYNKTVRDAYGNNPVTTGPFMATLSLAPGASSVSSATNITSGPYDTLDIISFTFSPKTCDGDTIYLNGQEGIEIEEI